VHPASGPKGPALLLPGNLRLLAPSTARIPPPHARPLCTFLPCIAPTWQCLQWQRLWFRLVGLSAPLATAPEGVFVGPNSQCLSVHKPKGRACFHVSLPEGMVLCHHVKRLLTVPGYTGRCQWQWPRSLGLPGRAVPCIKLLSLPPPCEPLAGWRISAV